MKHWRIIIWAFPNPRRPCLDCKLNTDWCMAACNYIQLWRYIYVEIFAIVWNILRTAGGRACPSHTGDGCNWISRITHLTDDHSAPLQITADTRLGFEIHEEDICLSVFAPLHLSCFCRPLQKLITLLCRHPLSSEMLTVCCRLCSNECDRAPSHPRLQTQTAGISKLRLSRICGIEAEGVFKVSASPPKCNDRIEFCS